MVTGPDIPEGKGTTVLDPEQTLGTGGADTLVKLRFMAKLDSVRRAGCREVLSTPHRYDDDLLQCGTDPSISPPSGTRCLNFEQHVLKRISS